MMEMNQALIIVGGVIVIKMLDKVVAFFWDRFVAADDTYVKVKFCKVCEKARKDGDIELKREVKVVRGVLFIIAMKMKIPTAELQKLVDNGG